jgi:hypothetical protein
MQPASDPSQNKSSGSDRDEYGCLPTPPGIIRATRVLVAHFPELLKKHDREWVACDANGILFFGDSQEVLYKRCLKRGLRPDEFIVDYIMPGAIDDIDREWLNQPL